MSQPYRTPFVITPVSVGETVVDLSQIPSCPNDINHPQLVQSAADPTTVHDFPHPLRRDITRKAQIKTMTRGTTNHLFKVTYIASKVNLGPDGKVLPPLVLKIYGDGTDITIDRLKELAIHKLLADRDLASKLHSRFPNGYMYHFVDGHVCSEDRIRDKHAYAAVAREMARWHSVLPLAHIATRQDALSLQPGIWTTTAKWINAIPEGAKTWGIDKDKLRGEFQYLAERLLGGGGGTPDPKEPMVLGHGDLLCGNIILRDRPSVVVIPDVGPTNMEWDARFIDYEHATFCPRAFELANHFSEWAGFECNYSQLPTRLERRWFILMYLDAYSDIVKQRTFPTGDALSCPDFVTRAEMDKLMREVDAYRGFPGLYWGVCAVIQAETSTGSIDFDYKGYAKKRLAEYYAWRAAEEGKNVEGEASARDTFWNMEGEGLGPHPLTHQKPLAHK